MRYWENEVGARGWAWVDVGALRLPCLPCLFSNSIVNVHHLALRWSGLAYNSLQGWTYIRVRNNS